MKVSHNENYCDPGVVVHEIATSLEPASVLAYLMDTVAQEGGFVQRRKEAVSYWLGMRQQPDLDLKAIALRVAAHHKTKLEQGMDLFRR